MGIDYGSDDDFEYVPKDYRDYDSPGWEDDNEWDDDFGGEDE